MSENKFFIFSVFHKKSHGLYQGFWIVTISDITILKEAYENSGVRGSATFTYKHDRLNSVGLLENDSRILGGLIFTDIELDDEELYMKLTTIGEVFCKFAFGVIVEQN